MKIFSINPFSWLVSRVVNAFNVKEFLAFAIIVFVGFLIGNFIVGLVPSINTNSPLGALIAFVVPVLIVYMIWARWGRKVAD